MSDHRSRDGDYPLWFRMSVLGVLLGLLVFNIIRDGDVSTTLMLCGIIGTALGFNEVVRRRGD